MPAPGRCSAPGIRTGATTPPSTLKTLLLLTLQPLLDPHRVVVGTAQDENIEGSRVGLVRGGRYPVALLFQALVLQSGNDAANALARTAGGVPVTVAAMNETAAAIGAYDTVAGTPSGLDVAGQSSSPYDLALIFRRLLARPDAAAVLRLPAARMPAVPGRGPGFQIQSQNPLLHTYRGDLGGKTGFTDAARHTYVTAAERGGRRIVVSLMDTENRPVYFGAQAARLLDWGFSVPRHTVGVGVLVDSGALAPGAARRCTIRTGHRGPRRRPSPRPAFPGVWRRSAHSWWWRRSAAPCGGLGELVPREGYSRETDPGPAGGLLELGQVRPRRTPRTGRPGRCRPRRACPAGTSWATVTCGWYGKAELTSQRAPAGRRWRAARSHRSRARRPRTRRRTPG